MSTLFSFKLKHGTRATRALSSVLMKVIWLTQLVLGPTTTQTAEEEDSFISVMTCEAFSSNYDVFVLELFLHVILFASYVIAVILKINTFEYPFSAHTFGNRLSLAPKTTVIDCAFLKQRTVVVLGAI